MKLFVFFLLLVVAFGKPHPHPRKGHLRNKRGDLNCHLATRDDLLPCLKENFDLNHDDKVTSDELHAMEISPCRRRHTPPTLRLFNKCDANKNGIVDMSDWNHPDACLKTKHSVFRVCMKCNFCQRHKNNRKKNLKHK